MSGSNSAPILQTYGLTNGFANNGAGSVYNLLDPNTYNYTVGNFGNPGLGGLTAPAAAAFDAFTTGAFNSLQSQGAANLQYIGSRFDGWANYQQTFATRMADIFQSIAGKSAKAASGLFGSIFG